MIKLMEVQGDLVSDDMWQTAVEAIDENDDAQANAARQTIAAMRRGAANEVGTVCLKCVYVRVSTYKWLCGAGVLSSYIHVSLLSSLSRLWISVHTSD